MIKAIIFDCWSTLFYKGASFTGALSNCLKLENNDDFEKRVGKSLMLSPCLDKFEAANRLLAGFDIIPEKEIINKVAEILGASWNAKPYPHTLETLRELKSKGYKLAIISNSFNLTFEEVVSKYDLAGIFDVIIVSYEVGSRKPDPEIFEICLEKLAVEKDEALMVGDSLQDDIEAAQSFGIKALMLDNKNKHPNYSPRIALIKDIFSYL